MLFLDVLHGASDGEVAPDAKDASQYISLMVAIDRQTKQVAYMAFHFPPAADQKQGFFVAFANDKKVNGQWTVAQDPGSLENLGFDSCDQDSCVARLREGKVDDGKGGLIDLAEKFMSDDHVWLLYAVHGKPIRTMIPLGGYKATYRNIMTTELLPQR
jgi:hypothetical protein